MPDAVAPVLASRAGARRAIAGTGSAPRTGRAIGPRTRPCTTPGPARRRDGRRGSTLRWPPSSRGCRRSSRTGSPGTWWPRASWSTTTRRLPTSTRWPRAPARRRIAVVREAAGEAAYAAGHYAEALAELRAAKRMNGATAYLPIMADCHRALGKPQDALKLAEDRGRELRSRGEGGDDDRRGRCPSRPRPARRGAADPELAPLQSKNRGSWVLRLRSTPTPTLSRPRAGSRTHWPGSTARTPSTAMS